MAKKTSNPPKQSTDTQPKTSTQQTAAAPAASQPAVQSGEPNQVLSNDAQQSQAANPGFFEGMEKVLQGKDPYSDNDGWQQVDPDTDQDDIQQTPPAQPTERQQQTTQPPSTQSTTQKTKDSDEQPKSSKTLSAVERLKQASDTQQDDEKSQQTDSTRQSLPDPDQPIPEYQEGKTKADQWKQVHETKNEAIRRAVRAEEEAARAKETVHETYRKQLEEQRKQIEELDGELQRVAAEKSPRLQAEFRNRQSQIDSKIKNIIPPDKQEQVRQLLQSPPSETRTQQLEEIYGELSALRQQEFRDVWSEQNKLRDEREQKIQQSMLNRQEEAQNAEQERQQQLQKARDIFNTVQSQYLRKYSTSDNPEWNNQLEEALAGAKNDFEADLPMEQLSDITIRARMAPVYANLAIQLSEELAEAQEQLQRFQKSEPDLGQHQDTDQPTEEDPSKMLQRYGSAGAAIAAGFQRQGGQLG